MTQISPKIRQQVLERDKNTCIACNQVKPRLNVHHKKAKDSGGTDDLDNLISLCGSCHRVIHAYKEYRHNNIDWWVYHA